MWLILCSRDDPAAIWAWGGLRQLANTSVELLFTEELAFSPLFDHHLDGRGARVRIGVSEHRWIESSQVTGVLNRVVSPPRQQLERVATADLAYAEAEIQAFYLSWLSAFPGNVINRPHPFGLAGPWFHASEWFLRAARAGLPVKTYRQSSLDTVQPACCRAQPHGSMHHIVAFSDAVFGLDLPEPIQIACSRLVRASPAKMLGIDFCRTSSDGYQFVSATPLPHLMVGGKPLLNRLAKMLADPPS
jgi:hypothetical protein